MASPDNSLVPISEAIFTEFISSHRYRSFVPTDYCILKTANGGFLLSLVQSALKGHFTTTNSNLNQPHTINIQCTFLRAVVPDEIEIHITDEALGKTTSTTSFTVWQGGRKCLMGFASNANLTLPPKHNHKSQTRTHITPLTPSPLRANLSLLQTHGTDGIYIRYRTFASTRSPLRPAIHFNRYVPIAAQASGLIQDHWLSLYPPSQNFTTEMLGMVVDSYPRFLENYLPGSAFSMASLARRGALQLNGEVDEDEGVTFPMLHPSVAIGLEVKKELPAEGIRFLFMRAVTKEIRDGRFDSEVLVYDENMELVALSHQVNLCLERDFAGVRKEEMGGGGVSKGGNGTGYAGGGGESTALLGKL